MAKLTSAQESVVMHDQGNILISASAGSGKTHTMIERVIRLILEKKASIEQLLAVTFTEKAAADMKEKLKNALIKTYEETRDDKLIAQLNGIPTSDISTIHSFCARIIRSYFYKAGVSPDFKIADDADSAIVKNECLERTFREFYTEGEDWFLDIVDKHAQSRSDSALKELIVKAHEFCSNEPNPQEIIDKYKEYFTADGVEKFATEYKKSIDEKINIYLNDLSRAESYFDDTELEKAKAFIEQLSFDMQEALKLTDVFSLKKYQEYSLKVDFERKLDEEALFYKTKAVNCRNKFKKLMAGVCSNLTDMQTEKQRVFQYYRHAEGFGKILCRFSKLYDEAKREENILDFSDLEHFALKVLRDDETRTEITKKYKYLFIDEYQDVNTVQEEILTLVSSNNLLMVGDLKQGIYAFRGCRSEIFAGKLVDMPNRGEDVVRLNENFRSAKKVVEMVNRIFNYCMTDTYFEENYKGNAELVFGGLFPEGQEGRAELHFLKKEAEEKQVEKPRIYDILEELDGDNSQENSTIALLTTIINDELTKKIYDAKEKKERQVQLRDIAILTRAKKGEFVADIVKGLTAHNIPVVADAKENVCDFSEISMLVNAVKLIDCFEQDVPLASTLKSPIGGLKDEDLFDIVKFYRQTEKYGSFVDAYNHYLLNGEGELKNRLLRFDEYFKRVRFLSDFVGAYGALDNIVKDREIESYLLAQTAGRTKVLRLKRFMSAAIVGDKRLTVNEFLKKIESSADSFGLLECGNENAVRVMTMHASKGLEFPVVIVCGLERKFDSQDDAKEILFSRKYGFVPRYYDEQRRIKEKTLFRGVVTTEQGRERIKEEMRLFYVATTRATYSLHLVFAASKDSRSDEFISAYKFVDFIPSDIPATEHNPQEFDFVELKKGRRKVIIANYDEDRAAEISQRINYVYPHLEETKLPLKSNVTLVTKNFEEEVVNSRILFPDETTDNERGNIAHKIMEHFDFSIDKTVGEQALYMVQEGIIEEEHLKKVNLDRMEKAVASSGIRELKKKRLYREKGFLTQVKAKDIFPEVDTEETVVLQGVIDLLALDENEAVIVDYKYSTLNKDGLVGKYKKQLDLYASAVERVLAIKVTAKKIVNIFTGECVEIA